MLTLCTQSCNKQIKKLSEYIKYVKLVVKNALTNVNVITKLTKTN